MNPTAMDILHLIDELEEETVDGLFQLACGYYGATATCMVRVNILLREQGLLTTEITEDLSRYSDEVLLIKSSGSDDRAPRAARELMFLRKNLLALRRHLRAHGQLPADWRKIRVTRPVYSRITLTRDDGSTKVLYDRNKPRFP